MGRRDACQGAWSGRVPWWRRAVAGGAGTAQLLVCRACGQAGATRLWPRVRRLESRWFPGRWPAPGTGGGTTRGVAAADQVKITDSHHPALQTGAPPVRRGASAGMPPARTPAQGLCPVRFAGMILLSRSPHCAFGALLLHYREQRPPRPRLSLLTGGPSAWCG